MFGPAARSTRPEFLDPVPFIAAITAVAAAAAFTPEMPAGVTTGGSIALMALASILGALVAHDGAHWIAARLTRLRIASATIGPLLFLPSRRGLHMRAVRRWRDIGAGLVAAPENDRRGVGRLAVVTAAGPAASLALAIAVADSAPLLAAASLARFTLAALPLWRDSRPTDGARLLTLLSGGAGADRLCALQRIAAAQRAGARPRAWPERWTLEATALRDGTRLEALACVAAFRRAVDGCAHERATAFLDRALALRARLPHTDACALLADAAYFEARIHHDVTRARGWLEEAAARRPACPVAERRAAAAVLLAAGDPAGGAAAAREALELTERIEVQELRALPMEMDWLREMLARAESASALPGALPATSS